MHPRAHKLPTWAQAPRISQHVEEGQRDLRWVQVRELPHAEEGHGHIMAPEAAAPETDSGVLKLLCVRRETFQDKVWDKYFTCFLKNEHTCIFSFALRCGQNSP